MWRFGEMDETALRMYEEANPDRVNDVDSRRQTPLWVAAIRLSNLKLVKWLVDVKGADVNGRVLGGQTVLGSADLARHLQFLPGPRGRPHPLRL